MKKIIIKLFLFMCALIFMLEGAILLMVCLGQFSIDEVTAFYGHLLQTPDWFDILYGITAAFLCFGLILLLGIFRKSGQIETIEVRDKGEMIRIPVKTIEDFINQIIRMNGRFSDVYVGIKKKRKWIHIDIEGTYTGHSPIRNEITEVKNVLKGEIKRVFEFSHLRIDFQVDGVQGDFLENGDTKKETDENFSIEEETKETRLETDNLRGFDHFQGHSEEIIKGAMHVKTLKGKMPWK